jgi:hypothetical protein
VEVGGTETLGEQQPQHVAIHRGPQRFEEVEGEAVAILLVGVQDSQAWVQADGDRGESALRLGQGVAVVEQRVDWVGGVASGASTAVQRATARPENPPVVGDAVGVTFGEAVADGAGPGAEVGVADFGLQVPALDQVARIPELFPELADRGRNLGRLECPRRWPGRRTSPPIAVGRCPVLPCRPLRRPGRAAGARHPDRAARR